MATRQQRFGHVLAPLGRRRAGAAVLPWPGAARSLASRRPGRCRYLISLSPTPAAPGSMPLGTMVQHDGTFGRRGIIIAYNGDNSGFYHSSRYPYVVLWDNGYFEVYSPSSLVVRV